MTTYRVYNKEYVIDIEADSFVMTSAGPDDPHVYEFKKGDEIVAMFEFHSIIGVKELDEAQDS